MSMTIDEALANPNLQEYHLDIRCFLDKTTGNRYQECPFCHTVYDHFLFFIDGMCFCKHCMGKVTNKSIVEVLRDIAEERIAIVIGGELKKINPTLIGIIEAALLAAK